MLVDSGAFDWQAACDASGRFAELARPYDGFHGMVFSEESSVGAFLLRARREGLRDFGACMSPHTAWLILQGIETLPLRMARHMENTRKVVAFLAGHPMVESVGHPELESHPDHALARRLLPRGAGSVFSFDLRGSRAQGRAFIEAVKIFSHLANVGDCRSLVIHPASTTHFRMDDTALSQAGITPWHDPPVDRSRRCRRPHRRPQARPRGCEEGRLMDLLVDMPGSPKAAYAYSGGKGFDPRLPVVVFIHGALHDHSIWTLLSRWFANHGHSVLALDLPAHGRSAGPALRSVEALARWVLAVLDAAGVGNAALVGHSMGSLIALEAAAIAPARTTRLALLGTAVPMPVAPALLQTAMTSPLEAIDMVNAFSHSTFAAKPGNPGPGSWSHGGNRALMRRIQSTSPEPNLFRVDFEICDAYAGGLDAARKVSCPTTLVLGSRDQMTAPRQAAAVGEALKAQVTTVPAGHAMLTEAPDAVLAALRGALG